MIKTLEILEVEKSASETAEKTHHLKHGDTCINKSSTYVPLNGKVEIIINVIRIGDWSIYCVDLGGG